MNITPTWRGAFQILALVLQDGTDAAKQAAFEELMRIADQLDALNAGAPPELCYPDPDDLAAVVNYDEEVPA